MNPTGPAAPTPPPAPPFTGAAPTRAAARPPAPRRPSRAGWLVRQHVIPALAIVLVPTLVIAVQVTRRDDFASSELASGVQDRWGAPVQQPAPSLRYVQSGTVFTELRPLAFDKQHVLVQAEMNYRKRGLRYFSGFDFNLAAQYAVHNREGHDIEVAFIFPLEVDKSQVLLSELQFLVNGEEERLDLGETGNRLVWTGRIRQGETGEFSIRYKARGLDSFLYRLDPSLPARDVHLRVEVNGGDNFDYPANALSATRVEGGGERVALDWTFRSLESGVSLGVVLPSEKTFDALIATMSRRAWLPFLAFFSLLLVLGLRYARPLHWYEAWLVSAAFGFSFVLLAYLAAFMNFYLAWTLSIVGLGAVITLYLHRLFPQEKLALLGGAWAATMVVPSAAVFLPGYTGLIYTLELLALLLGLMVLSTRSRVRAFLSDLTPGPVAQNASTP